jgi:hypothetical protein
MPFAWRQFEPSQVGQLEKFDIPLNEWMGLKFGEGWSSGLGRAVWDMGEDFAWDTGEEIDPKILNASFGIKGYLEFDRPMTVGRAALLNERKKDELQRMAMLDSASHSGASLKGAAGFISGLAGGFANPVDLSTAFIPFVGSAAKAAPIARMGKGLLGAEKAVFLEEAVIAGRAALARGIVTQETIGLGRGASVTASMIDGVLSQAAVEIPIAIEKTRNKEEYGANDYLFNVIAGGLFAGGLNLAGQALEVAYKRAIGKAVDFHNRSSSETKERFVRETESAFVEGRTPDTDKIIRIDEEAIRAKVEAERFNEEAAKIEAMRNPEVWDEIKSEVQASVKGAQEAIQSGDLNALMFRMQELPTSSEIIASGVDLTKLLPEVKGIVEQFPDVGRVMVGDRPLSKWIADVESGKLNDISKYFSVSTENLQKIINSNRPESFKKAAREALEVRQINEAFPYERAVETERNKRIAEFVEKKRKEWKDGLEGRVSEAKRQEIAKQQAEGKQLSKEDAARYESRASTSRADLEIIKQDTDNLEAELREMAGVEPKTKEGEGASDSFDSAAAASFFPPVQNGFVRFFHGGFEGGVTSNPRWVSQYLDYAAGYARKSNADIFYVDVPKDNPLLRKSFEEFEGGPKFPYSNFEAPAELMKNAKKVPKELWEGKSIPQGLTAEKITASSKSKATQRQSSSSLTDAEMLELQRELAELDSDVYSSQAKAVKGAAPCAGKVK